MSTRAPELASTRSSTRDASGSGSGARFLALPCYLVLALLLTWPLARHFGQVLPAAPGWSREVLGGPFIVGWVLKTLFRDPAKLFDLPIFHPEPLALAYTDHLIGESLLAAPFVALTGNLAAGINALVVLSFTLSGWAVYRLARQIGVSRAGAFLAGFLFAFGPFRFSNLTFLNQLHTQLLPLGLFFALRFVRGHRRRDLFGAVVVLAAQSYFGWYYAFYLALAFALLGVHALAVGWIRRGDIRWSEVALAAVVGVALVLPGLLPYLKLRRSMPGYERSLGMTALYSADLLDYLRVNRGNWLLGRWPALTAGLACWPGFVTAALSLLALGALVRGGRTDAAAPSARIGARLKQWGMRAGEAGYFPLLGAVSFVLSLGPVLHVAGRLLPVPLPYALLYYAIPGFSSLRGPARLAVLALLAAAVLAGVGYDLLVRRAAAGRAARVVLFGFTLALAIVTSISAIEIVPFPTRESMPPAYHWLARQPGTFAIAEIPVPATERDEDEVDATRQLYILYHGHPSLDGTTGFVPPAGRRLRAVLQGGPSAAALRELSNRGARYLVVHLDELDPGVRSAWERGQEQGLVEGARFGNDVVYELGRWSP